MSRFLSYAMETKLRGKVNLSNSLISVSILTNYFTIKYYISETGLGLFSEIKRRGHSDIRVHGGSCRSLNIMQKNTSQYLPAIHPSLSETEICNIGILIFGTAQLNNQRLIPCKLCLRPCKDNSCRLRLPFDIWR